VVSLSPQTGTKLETAATAKEDLQPIGISSTRRDAIFLSAQYHHPLV
jgi:hypothetical protein